MKCLKFKNPECYFYQGNKCILSKWFCFLCAYQIKKIEGITQPNDYLNYVSNKRVAKHTFVLSFLSLMISIFALFVSLIKK